MSFFDPQNPGIGGLDELTDAEALVVQQIAGLGDPGGHRILGWDDTDNAFTWFIIGSGLTYDAPTNTLSVSASGSGIDFETPTGTVNGSNTTFSATNEPVFVVADGMVRFNGAGVTISGSGPYTIEFSALIPPVEFVRSVYNA